MDSTMLPPITQPPLIYALFLGATVIFLVIDLSTAYFLPGLVVGFFYLYALVMACWNFIQNFQKQMGFIALNCLIAIIGILVGAYYIDDCAKENAIDCPFDEHCNHNCWFHIIYIISAIGMGL